MRTGISVVTSVAGAPCPRATHIAADIIRTAAAHLPAKVRGARIAGFQARGRTCADGVRQAAADAWRCNLKCCRVGTHVRARAGTGNRGTSGDGVALGDTALISVSDPAGFRRFLANAVGTISVAEALAVASVANFDERGAFATVCSTNSLAAGISRARTVTAIAGITGGAGISVVAGAIGAPRPRATGIGAGVKISAASDRRAGRLVLGVAVIDFAALASAGTVFRAAAGTAVGDHQPIGFTSVRASTGTAGALAGIVAIKLAAATGGRSTLVVQTRVAADILCDVGRSDVRYIAGLHIVGACVDIFGCIAVRFRVDCVQAPHVVFIAASDVAWPAAGPGVITDFRGRHAVRASA